ncbi:MAG: gamma-glutamylcyclotransferase [Dehalococcoidales bacterium]|nr:gamma-glutamylcyclotransferase [Dehalococcoidales bacterium]
MYYFAYASNLSRKQMSERCPDAQPKFVATLPNYKLIFAGWSRKWHGGVASIKPFRGERVIGAIYELSERGLRQLDKYEGYPDIYTRVNVIVTDGFGNRMEAVTYVKVEQSEETQPSKEYLAIIQQGYKDWGIVLV